MRDLLCGCHEHLGLDADFHVCAASGAVAGRARAWCPLVALVANIRGDSSAEPRPAFALARASCCPGLAAPFVRKGQWAGRVAAGCFARRAEHRRAWPRASAIRAEGKRRAEAPPRASRASRCAHRINSARDFGGDPGRVRAPTASRSATGPDVVPSLGPELQRRRGAVPVCVRWANQARRVEIRDALPMLRGRIAKMCLADRLGLTP